MWFYGQIWKINVNIKVAYDVTNTRMNKSWQKKRRKLLLGRKQRAHFYFTQKPKGNRSSNTEKSKSLKLLKLKHTCFNLKK